MKSFVLISFLFCGTISVTVNAQTGPWNNPLRMAWSSNGITFGPNTIFQDSSGVPSAIRWKGDTLICAFQWFRQPKDSPTWDRVAVKYSYDNGISWTQAAPIVIDGFPPDYQRPFDPTLAVFGKDSIRIYFSSSVGKPMKGLDSTVNTYSARSKDGTNYIFEPGARVDEPTTKVIDPGVIFFKNLWHLTAPIGAPQDGAFHYVSNDGVKFSKVPNIPSDNIHNWTGNFVLENPDEIRFYGSGPQIWFNYSNDGGKWKAYTNTNIKGGDPTVVKISENNYLMIYVGAPYVTGTGRLIHSKNRISLSPNPVISQLTIDSDWFGAEFYFQIYGVTGNLVMKGNSKNRMINVRELERGIYFMALNEENAETPLRMLKFVKI